MRLGPGIRRDDGSAFLMIRRIAATWSLFMPFYLVSAHCFCKRYCASTLADKSRAIKLRPRRLGGARHRTTFERR